MLGLASLRVSVVLKHLLGVGETIENCLLADDLGDVADGRADWVTRDREAEKEEDVLILVAKVRLLVLLVEVHRACLVELKCREVVLTDLA